MVIGAHVSSSGGIKNAVINANNLGIKYFQTFLSAPQSYNIKDYSEEEIAEFLKAKEEHGIEGCFAHAIYLLNFASDKAQNIYLSKTNLVKTLNTSAKLKFNGVIIHIGSTKDTIENGVKAVSENIKIVLEESDPDSFLFLENSAGAGNHIGSDLDHLVEIINQNKGNQRLKVCIDTQHSHAAGYPIKDSPKEYLDLMMSKLGDRIQLIHLNDSKTEFNSKRDRHENIGEGLIGFDSLREFCIDSRLDKIPLILEVPGFENKGPDKKNLEIVESFLSKK